MKWLFLLLLLPLAAGAQLQPCDLLITNGRIIDGTGNSWYQADIAERRPHLAIGHALRVSPAKTIDASGKIVAPGFIDVHTHIEGTRPNNLPPNFYLRRVTTVVAGNRWRIEWISATTSGGSIPEAFHQCSQPDWTQ